jgi:anti-sigma regulatory factor (Ser/Thr protein kinase)
MGLARGMGFEESEANAIGTVVSELATNVLKYATSGVVLLEEFQEGSRAGLQVTVTDRGPGIENIDEALQDHFSSSGTLGLGLPGVRRMVDDFDLTSKPGVGTKVIVRKWRGSRHASSPFRAATAASANSDAFAERGTTRGEARFPGKDDTAARLEVAFVNRPCRGELVSGDAVAITEADGGVLIGVVDGLGHGREANVAAKAAVRLIRERGTLQLEQLMIQVNERLARTVGAAVSLCWIDLGSGAFRYAAVGNTVLRLEGDTSRRIAATAGTVGTRLQRVRVETATLQEGEVLLIHSDGISERATFKDYPQLRFHGAAVIADRVVSRYGKRHDDAAVVACRWER